MCSTTSITSDTALLAITQNQTTYVVRNACIMTFCVTEARMLDDSLKDTMSYYRTFSSLVRAIGQKAKGQKVMNKGLIPKPIALFDFMVEITYYISSTNQ